MLNELRYARPILIKKDIYAQFCPSIIIGNVISQMYKNTTKEGCLIDLFKTWKNNYLGVQKDYKAMINSWK